MVGDRRSAEQQSVRATSREESDLQRRSGVHLGSADRDQYFTGIRGKEQTQRTSAGSPGLTGLVASIVDLELTKSRSFPLAFHDVTVAPKSLERSAVIKSIDEIASGS